MSYEKKMKELLGRLVSMSPEPPTYPEEAPMAAEPKTTRKIHPALVFAGAAALVAVVAIPLFFLGGGEAPVAGESTTTTSVPADATTLPVTSTTITTSTTVPQTSTTVASVWQGVVYLVQAPQNSFLGNPALIPLEIEVTDPSTRLGADSSFTEALAAVEDDLPEGTSNVIPSDVQVVGLVEEPGLITADMNEAFLAGAGGLLADTTMLNQLIYTMTYGQPDASVLFTVQGEPVETFGSEGMVLTDPVDRETFIEELALIFLTEPISEVEHVFVVTGRANTYEATVQVAVLDANGDAVHEEFTTATCGTGCWGEFGVGLDADLVTPGETSIRVFTYSAEDGSISDAIIAPIPDGGVWSLTAG